MRLLLVIALLGACGEPAAPRPMHEALRQEIRPTDTSVQQMFRFDPGEGIERFGVDGGEFVVHFTRAGRNAVPARDTNDSGVPDFVEDVAQVYEDVGVTYRRWGFRQPLRDTTVSSNGGDGRFDVYLLDFARSSDGAFRLDECSATNPDACIGYMVQENDFVGYGYPSLTEATRILGSHEFFHAVQAAYDAEQNVIVSEGTAVWATEQDDPSSDDFENFIGAYLSRPDRSLDSASTGPVPASAYGTAIFFRFLSERHDAALIRALWEHLENGHGFDSEPADKANPTWLVQLDALLRANYQSSFAQAYEEFATWNLFTASAADPSRSYANGAQYPAPGITTATAPYRAFPMRVFYASTQYVKVPVGGRATMNAALFDDPDLPGDETDHLVLVAATRRGGRNVEVKRVNGPIDTSMADELIVAVINTARAGNGAQLSKRPGLCIGTDAEVQACRDTIAPVDAGVPSTVDAGVSLPSASQPLPAAMTGCGCGMSGGLAPLLILAFAALTRRRPT